MQSDVFFDRVVIRFVKVQFVFISFFAKSMVDTMLITIIRRNDHENSSLLYFHELDAVAIFSFPRLSP